MKQNDGCSLCSICVRNGKEDSTLSSNSNGFKWTNRFTNFSKKEIQAPERLKMNIAGQGWVKEFSNGGLKHG